MPLVVPLNYFGPTTFSFYVEMPFHSFPSLFTLSCFCSVAPCIPELWHISFINQARASLCRVLWHLMEPLLELRWMEQVRTQSEWIIGEASRGPLKLLAKTFMLIRNGSACLSTCEACGLPTVCVGEACILSVSLKECNARVEISETFLSLIKFIENSNPSIPKNLAFCDLKMS